MLGIKGWKSYLLWEGLPFLLPISVFGFISAINWGYESKLITPNKNITDWHDAHLGLTLLMMVVIFALIASGLLFLVRFIASRIANPNLGVAFRFLSLTAIAVLLIFPGLFIIILGPAAITMKEQMDTVPSNGSLDSSQNSAR